MKHLRERIATKKPGVEDVDIEKCEDLLRAKLPDKYKQLVRLVNQPEIEEWILYPIKDSRRISKTFDDIVRNNKDAEIPNDLIAFAEDGTGDLLCFQVIKGQMRETILFWKHEDQEYEVIYEDIEEMIRELIEEDC
ncbi:SMI1/KNR4 family protein [Paenibacillus tundrae]|uniref:SMI1/KNR4 family protein n=1 Tax=Paenibacillus tundrae TaxID=528187 RepID=UPI0030CCCEE4